ncbi:MAG TPA: poly(A) polymerase, partial [Sphaerochaeta sp.]|nr:poly(A) polymerase [Sphaerochaeta sp.]
PQVMLADMIKALVDPLIVFADDQLSIDERFKETFRQIKVLISPMTPSNYEVELASERLLSARGFKTPRNCVRTQRPVNKPPQRRGPSRPKRNEGTGEVSSASRKRRSRGRSSNRSDKGSREQEQNVSTSAEAHDL